MSMVYPPLIDTTDTLGPSASTIRPNAETSLPLQRSVAIQPCHTNSPDDVYVPRAKKHPHFVALLFKLHATAPLWLCLIDAARQNSRIHPVQFDGLKQAQNWMQTYHVESTGQM